MKNRSLLIIVVWLFSAGLSLAEGEYQPTKNGRIQVWNSAPKPGDSATWKGGRDREGYADGFGTLTWYTQRGDEKPAVYGIYYGNMVRGKFEGPVNVHLEGKVAHANFANGTRASRWVRGPAPNRRVTQKETKTKERESAHSRETAEPTPPAVAATPAKRPEPLKVEATPAPKIAESTEEKTETQDSRVETAPGATPTPAPVVAEKPKPTATARPKSSPPKPVVAGKQKAKFDDSLRALVGPPSTLRTDSVDKARAEHGDSPPGPESAGSVPKKSGPAELTEKEALNLAYTEAVTQGYNLGNYESPKADYSKALDRWSVFYVPRTGDAAEGTTKPLIIAVEDKTKKAYVSGGHAP